MRLQVSQNVMTALRLTWVTFRITGAKFRLTIIKIIIKNNKKSRKKK